MIASRFEESGFTVFYDFAIPVGDHWDAHIERELNSARAVVVLWSNAARDSRWVKLEARQALSRKILCPAVLERTEIPLEFTDVQAADLRNWSGDPSNAEWRRLIASIQQKLGGVQGRQFAEPPPLQPHDQDQTSRDLPTMALATKGLIAGAIATALATVAVGWPTLPPDYPDVPALPNKVLLMSLPVLPFVVGLLGMFAFASRARFRWAVVAGAVVLGPATHAGAWLWRVSTTQVPDPWTALASSTTYAIISISVVVLLCMALASRFPRIVRTTQTDALPRFSPALTIVLLAKGLVVGAIGGGLTMLIIPGGAMMWTYSGDIAKVAPLVSGAAGMMVFGFLGAGWRWTISALCLFASALPLLVSDAFECGRIAGCYASFVVWSGVLAEATTAAAAVAITLVLCGAFARRFPDI